MSAKAIILAGGLGTRLREAVCDVPKPMAPVAGKPFLEYLINSLAVQGYKDIILSVGYKWETIRAYFGDGDSFDIQLRYCVEETPLGTGGALREALETSEASRFIVLNGDTFNRLDYRNMEAYHRSKKALFTVGLVYKRNAGRYGLVHVDEEDRILRFSEKTSSGGGYINGGVYIMDKTILDLMPRGHFSLEADLLPKLVGNAFYGYPDRHFFVDIGVVSTYRYVNRHPALFQEKADRQENTQGVVMNNAKTPMSGTTSDHYLFNIVYNYINDNQIHAVHKGNISLVWSRQPIKDADLSLYENLHSFTGVKNKFDVLCLNEPIVVLPGQYDPEVWKQFDHVVTLYDSLIADNANFSKFLSPRTGGLYTNETEPETVITEDISKRKHLYPTESRINGICMVSGNKRSLVPGELYSKRIKTALWFHNNSDLRFDVYGTMPFFLPNYRGMIPRGRRLETLRRYRFCLSFENMHHTYFSAGYVDKIFDCLETRTIPIYLGAPNVADYIPEGCYIDFRKFKSYKQLDKYLYAMTEKEYEGFITRIDNFVSQGGLRPYCWDSLYDHLLSIFADRLELPLERVCTDPLSTWNYGMSPSYNGEIISEIDAPLIWTFESLATGASPLVRQKEHRAKDGANTPDEERFEHIRTLQEKERFKDAIDEFAYLGGAGNDELHYLFARLLLYTEQYESAQIHLEIALNANRSHSKANNDLGALYLMKGDFKRAVECFHRAVTTDRQNRDALHNLLTTLIKLNLKDYASSFVQDLMCQSPGDEELSIIAGQYGLAYDQKSLSTVATSDVPLLNESMDSSTLSKMAVVEALTEEGKHEEALRLVQPLMAQCGKVHAGIHYLHARILNSLGQAEMSIAALFRTIESDHGHSRAYNDLGCYFFQKREYVQAHDHLRTAVFVNPRNFNALANYLRLLLFAISQGQKIDIASALKSLFPHGVKGIGAEILPPGAKRALLLHSLGAVPWYAAGMLDEFPLVNASANWWESVDTAALLNKVGYVVDVMESFDQKIPDTDAEWNGYDLIVDRAGPDIVGQTDATGSRQIFYITSRQGQHHIATDQRHNSSSGITHDDAFNGSHKEGDNSSRKRQFIFPHLTRKAYSERFGDFLKELVR